MDMATDSSGNDKAVPLTTVWTPECGSILSSDQTSTASCQPPNWDVVWLEFGYYSPGICFNGYTAGCDITYRDIEPGETAMNCVPRGWDCSTEDFYAVTVDESGAKTSVPALEIRWREEDLTLLETHPLTPGLVVTEGAESGSRATSASAPTDEPDDDNGGISTGAVAGIAVGATALVAILVGVAFFVWYRKRKQRAAAAGVAAAPPAPATSSGSSVEKPPGGLVYYGGPPVPGMVQYPGAMPTEMPGAHYHTKEGAVELHGRNLVYELPAQSFSHTPAGPSRPASPTPAASGST